MSNHLLTAYDRNATLLSALQSRQDDSTMHLRKAVAETHDFLHQFVQGRQASPHPDLGLNWGFASLNFRNTDESLAFLCYQLSLFWSRTDILSIKRAEQLSGILAKIIENLPRETSAVPFAA